MSNTRVVKVILISGRAGSGKTSVAYEIHAQLSSRPMRHGSIEGDNLDTHYPEPTSSKLFIANLHSCWKNFVTFENCDTLIINGSAIILDHELIRDTLKKATQEALGYEIDVEVLMWGFVLDCSDDTTRRRLEQREIGSALERHIASSSRIHRLLRDMEEDWIEHLNVTHSHVGDTADRIISKTFGKISGETRLES